MSEIFGFRMQKTIKTSVNLEKSTWYVFKIIAKYTINNSFSLLVYVEFWIICTLMYALTFIIIIIAITLYITL